jgi:hypothetical protein
MVQRTREVMGLREAVVEFTSEFLEYRRKRAVAQAGREMQRRDRFSRRRLLAGAVVSLACLFVPKLVAAKAWQPGASPNMPGPELLYPPVDLSYFDTPIGWRA